MEPILENPQEDKDDYEGAYPEQEIKDVLPWESTDPAIRRFFDDNLENRELDIIIRRECEQIESQLKAIREIHTNQGGASTTSSKLKRAKKKNMQFSEHYNFMCEFQKRLKIRIDGNRELYKFRKFKDDLQELKKLKLQQIEAKKMQKQIKLQAQKLKLHKQ